MFQAKRALQNLDFHGSAIFTFAGSFLSNFLLSYERPSFAQVDDVSMYELLVVFYVTVVSRQIGIRRCFSLESHVI